MRTWLILLSLLLASPAAAELPIPTYPDCGQGGECPSDYDPWGEWELGSGHPAEVPPTVLDPSERDFGSGTSVDRAWNTTTGRTDVVIAVMDSGIEWGQGELINKFFLHKGELPLPQLGDGTECAAYDCNDDGVFNIRDWDNDPRVSIDSGLNPGGHADNMLDPSDLIAAFSDDIDDDGNGYIDDIAGWDFFWNDNNAFDDVQQDGYSHGSKEGRWSVAEGNGQGGSIGTCPNCMLMPLRMGDGFVANSNAFANGAIYAVDMGVAVLQEALGSLNNTAHVKQAIEYCWDNGVTIIGSAADETAWHANMPGANHHILYTKAIRFDAPEQENTRSWFGFSNCTNYGGRSMLSSPAEGCSSGGVGRASGIAGLLHSAERDAVDAGVLDSPLSSAEFQQLFITTVDDIAFNPNDDREDFYPSREGWDRFFGYGRINAFKAVDAINNAEIPPEADVLAPDWFETFNLADGGMLAVEGVVAADRATSYTWELQVGVGWDPDPDAWDVVASGDGSDRLDGLLGSIDLSDLDLPAQVSVDTYTRADTNVTKGNKVHAHAVTLRVQVTDNAGLVGESRKMIFVQNDPSLRTGFPKRIATSLEPSLTLTDVNGDDIDDVVWLNSDGELFVGDGNMTPFDGWPVHFALIDEHDPDSPRNHLNAPAYVDNGLNTQQSHAAIATPAVGDLDGDGVVEIVAASLNGFLSVWHADGTEAEGWPFRMDRAEIEGMTGPQDDPETNNYDLGFFSSPALGDLDEDGDLEIVLGGMDGRVYVFHHDGTPLDGFPLILRETYDTSAGPDSHGERIISSPAIGDVDGDGHLEIAIGTNQKTTGTYGLGYLISHEGVVEDGWPVALFGAYTNALPYVGEGVPGSPSICDIDGDGTMETGMHTIADSGKIIGSDGSTFARLARIAPDFGPNTNTAEDSASFIMINSGAWADLNVDGVPEYLIGAMGFGYATGLLDDGRRHDHDHLLGAWSGVVDDSSGQRKLNYLDAFPRIMEDLQFFLNPSVVDIDNDGLPEALNGSAGSVVHAFNMNGDEPLGWPKAVGGWILSSPTVGDTDGDGFLEVWTATRNGDVFAWNTPSVAATANRQWVGFRHDPWNTGNCHTPLRTYPVIPPAVEDAIEEACADCAASAAGPAGGVAGLFLVLFGFIRRRSA
jgi:hypothetical protein